MSCPSNIAMTIMAPGTEDKGHHYPPKRSGGGYPPLVQVLSNQKAGDGRYSCLKET